MCAGSCVESTRQARRAGARGPPRPDATDLPAEPYHAYIVGEQALPTDARRHLVADRGVAKEHISFCGYWRVGAASPTPKSQLADAQAHA